MYCSNCGTKNEEGQAVCSKCFFAIKSNVKAPKMDTGEGYDLKDSNGNSRIVAMVFAWFLGAFGGHWFYLGNMKRGWLTLIAGLVGLVLVLPLFITAILSLIHFIKLAILADTEAFDDFSAET
jgi:TM2 domain-containing membrane protein YozV